jgi:transposase InsO family protein
VLSITPTPRADNEEELNQLRLEQEELRRELEIATVRREISHILGGSPAVKKKTKRARRPAKKKVAPDACTRWAEHGDLRVRRHYRRQAPRRLGEQAARTKAVAYAANCGDSVSCVARALDVAPRTLRHWRQCTSPAPRGRPPSGCPVADRNNVIGFLHQLTGPSVGLPALRRLFPHMSLCVLAELISRYRRVWRRRYSKRGFQLDWRRAGTVWAMDHSEACYPVDGVYPYPFAVRDLASKCQLAWHPCRTERAAEVIPVLTELFEQHAPPLVLKSDNGSAFIAEDTVRLLDRHEASHLRSRRRTPSYNGALERSNGTLKTYTQLRATRQGHPLRWTMEDLEAARQLNSIARSWEHVAPPPPCGRRLQAAATFPGSRNPI